MVYKTYNLPDKEETYFTFTFIKVIELLNFKVRSPLINTLQKQFQTKRLALFKNFFCWFRKYRTRTLNAQRAINKLSIISINVEVKMKMIIMMILKKRDIWTRYCMEIFRIIHKKRVLLFTSSAPTTYWLDNVASICYFYYFFIFCK